MKILISVLALPEGFQLRQEFFEKDRCNLRVPIFLTKPDNDCSCVRLYMTHDCDLFIALLDIVLIDAKSIDPE